MGVTHKPRQPHRLEAQGQKKKTGASLRARRLGLRGHGPLHHTLRGVRPSFPRRTVFAAGMVRSPKLSSLRITPRGRGIVVVARDLKHLLGPPLILVKQKEERKKTQKNKKNVGNQIKKRLNENAATRQGPGASAARAQFRKGAQGGLHQGRAAKSFVTSRSFSSHSEQGPLPFQRLLGARVGREGCKKASEHDCTLSRFSAH